MRIWVLCLLLGACHHGGPGSPVPEGGFAGRLDGRRIVLKGTAVYARCQDQYHIFLVTRFQPKSSITVHPMGFPLRGRHPIARGRAIETFRRSGAADSVPGPFYVAIVLPPDSVLDADSGFVDLFLSPENQIHGLIDGWVTNRHLTTSFIARRDGALELGLTDVTGCSR